jgi:hypothetical protein
MPVYDQIETEPYVFYSGSMADNVMFGSIFSTSQQDLRSQIASGVSGIISSSFYEKLMSRNERLAFLSNKKKPGPFVALSADSEIFNDSIMPAISDIVQSNEVLIPYMSASLPVALGIPGIFHGILIGCSADGFKDRPAIDTESLNILFSGTGMPITTLNPIVPSINEFIDSKWVNSFPFSSAYRTLKRVPVSYNVPEKQSMTKDIASNVIANPVLSDRLGSINVILPVSNPQDDPARIGVNSQIWAAPVESFGSNTQFKHVPSLLYENPSFVAFNPFPKETDSTSSGVYTLFATQATIATSVDGETWTKAQGVNQTTGGGTANLLDFPSYFGAYKPTPVYALPIGFGSSSSVIRKHWKWVVIYYDDIHTRISLEKTATTGSGSPIITSDTVFEDKQVSITNNLVLAGITAATEQNTVINGAITIRSVNGLDFYSSPYDGPVDSICFFGHTTGVNLESLIFFSNRNLSNALPAVAGTRIANCTWTAAVKRVNTNNIWFIGNITDGFGSRFGGKIGVIAAAASNSHTAAFTDLTANANAAWGSPGSPIPIPPCWGIDTDRAGLTIVVGDQGMILRCTNSTGIVGWQKITPANGFNKSFSSVQWVSGTGNTSTWVIAGDGGEVQISSDGGQTWNSVSIETPNTNIPLAQSLWIPQFTAGAGSGISKNDATFDIDNGGRYPSHKYILATSRESKESLTPPLLANPSRVVTIGGVSYNPLGLSAIDSGNVYFGYLVVRLIDKKSSTQNDVVKTLVSRINNYSSDPVISSDYSTINKYFFGYGDGIALDLKDSIYDDFYRVPQSKGKVGNIVNHTYYDMYGPPSLAQINAHDIEIRGYRYGAISHAPLNTSCIYRQARYGQFRDMLEQRPYTKFFDGTAMLESPVTINFVSGTVDYERAIDYVTNTNPSYDPRDSGFWDYEYRSGQPFYDIDNID